MDVSPKANYQTVLMRLDLLHEQVCISFVPEDLQSVVPIVAKEDMSLRKEVLVRVRIEGFPDPVDHFK